MKESDIRHWLNELKDILKIADEKDIVYNELIHEIEILEAILK
jgi:hypothetical protein